MQLTCWNHLRANWNLATPRIRNCSFSICYPLCCTLCFLFWTPGKPVRSPTECFAISEPQKPSSHVSKQPKNRRWTNFEGAKTVNCLIRFYSFEKTTSKTILYAYCKCVDDTDLNCLWTWSPCTYVFEQILSWSITPCFYTYLSMYVNTIYRASDRATSLLFCSL